MDCTVCFSNHPLNLTYGPLLVCIRISRQNEMKLFYFIYLIYLWYLFILFYSFYLFYSSRKGVSWTRQQ